MLKKATILLAVMVFVTGMVGFAFAANTQPAGMTTKAVSENDATVKKATQNAKESKDYPTYNAYPNTTTLKVDVGSGIKMCVSSNTKVAKVNTKGVVTAKNIGKAKIDVYRLTSKDKHDTFYIKVAKKQKLKTAKKSYIVTYGDEPFNLTVTTNANESNAITYASSDKKVVTVTKKGKVRIKDVGEAKIAIKAAASKSYHEAELQIPVKVNKKEPDIKVLNEDFTVSMIDTDKKLELESDSEGAYTYKSSDKKIAKVKKDGTIVPVSDGTATITVTQEETDHYASKSIEVIIEVLPLQVSDRIQGAINWAVTIANDNSFTYGTGKTAHRYGCYFCGTNIKKKGTKYDKTYCCNPFVFAAYAHGADDKSLLKVCQKGSGGGLSADTWTRYKVFVNVGATKKVSFSQLQPGDLVIKKGQHVWMYLGGDEMVEAGSEGWDAKSISVKKGASSRYSSYQKSEGCVIRYTGK